VHLPGQLRQAGPAGGKQRREQDVVLFRHVIGEQHGNLRGLPSGPGRWCAGDAPGGRCEVLVLGGHLADQAGQVVTFAGSTVNGLRLRHREGNRAGL